MRTLRFHGYSDDIVYVKGTDPDGRAEPSECFPEEDGGSVVFRVSVPDGEGCYVVVQRLMWGYGTWSVGIAPIWNDKTMPEWPMRWSFGTDDYDAQFELAMQALVTAPAGRYTTQLEIDAPDDAAVSLIYPPDDNQDDDCPCQDALSALSEPAQG